MTTTFSVRETRGNLVILPEHRENKGILFTKVVNFLILKIQDIAIFATKFTIFQSQFHLKKLSQFSGIGTGHIPLGQRKLRKFDLSGDHVKASCVKKRVGVA